MDKINGEQWKKVDTFGKGEIFAKGSKKKIVEKGLSDFEYEDDSTRGQPVQPQEKTPLKVDETEK